MDHKEDNCIFCRAMAIWEGMPAAPKKILEDVEKATALVDKCMRKIKEEGVKFKGGDLPSNKLTKETMDFIANDTFIMFLKHRASCMEAKNGEQKTTD